MNKPTFKIITLGCKVNAFESEEYAEELVKRGFQKTEEKAEVYLVNTCAVTNIAAGKCRQRIHAIRRDNPEALIAAIGCYVQLCRDDLSVFSDCQVIIGTHDKEKVGEKIAEAYRNKTEYIAVSEKNETVLHNQEIEHFFLTRAYLKIQDGCNQFCTYCTIPLARGRERSLPYDQAIAQAKKLISPQHQELVLTGIHTGRWQDGNKRLSDLIRGLLTEIPELKRLRLSSIEMNEVTPEIIEIMASEPRFAHHLHIPLQSASDQILKQMHRPYTFSEYKAKLEYIKSKIPNISISCDIIVGFPGETQEIFEEVKNNLVQLPLSFYHIFPYSIRNNTVAATLPGQLDGKTKSARVRELTILSARSYNNYQSTRLNQEAIVYVESKQGEYWFGHSSDYLPVYFVSETDVYGQFVPVKITKTVQRKVFGERI